MVTKIYGFFCDRFFLGHPLDSFENFDSEIKPFSKILPSITILMERLEWCPSPNGLVIEVMQNVCTLARP